MNVGNKDVCNLSITEFVYIPFLNVWREKVQVPPKLWSKFKRDILTKLRFYYLPPPPFLTHFFIILYTFLLTLYPNMSHAPQLCGDKVCHVSQKAYKIIFKKWVQRVNRTLVKLKCVSKISVIV